VLWDDENAIEASVPNATEPRFIVIGRIGEKFWTAVITYRPNAIRIISVRRSRQKEVEIYESQ